MVVNNNEEKVKDIRYEVSLGWADTKKRDSKMVSKSLISRIRNIFTTIKDIPDNL